MAAPAPVLLIRTEEQSKETAQRIQALGLRPIISPLLKIDHFEAPETQTFESVQAIILTSRNAVFALKNAPRCIPVYCLGDRAKEMIAQIGFNSVTAVKGNADELSTAMLQSVDPQKGTLLHLSGSHVDHSPLDTLSRQGFSVKELPVYRINYGGELRSEALEAILTNPCYALIYSARSAEAFCAAFQKAKLTAEGIACIAISEQAAAPLLRFRWEKLVVAERPEEEAMLSLLSNH